MSNLDQIREPVKEHIKEFEKYFRASMKSNVPLLDRITRYIVNRKGKQMRPLFVFLSAEIAGGVNESTYRGASLVELLHTASLVHDDVVDESDLRRGQETINYKWKNLIAVLMGDYLFAKAFRVMVGTGTIDLIDAISRATERVSVGELRQIEETANFSLSEEEYLDIIADKMLRFSVLVEDLLKNLPRRSGYRIG